MKEAHANFSPGSVDKVIVDILQETCPEFGLYASQESISGEISQNPDIFYIHSKNKEGLKIFEEINLNPIIQLFQMDAPAINVMIGKELENNQYLEEGMTERIYARYLRYSGNLAELKKLGNVTPITDEEMKEIVDGVVSEVLNKHR